jgi:hypothetical protein
MMHDPRRYIRWAAGIKLRPYQKEPLERIMQSIERHLGDTIILVFPRQSGKDELLVNLKAYLLHTYAPLPVGIVEVNPTYKPQTVAALERFDRSLTQNRLARRKWRKRGALMRFIGRAWVSFLSGDKQASTRGASASLLLIINEAQDIAPGVYAQSFEPMTASTNATRVLAGTVWTSGTLLAQEMRGARAAEKRDGRKRMYMVDADEVRKHVAWYGEHVDGAIQKYGREHPFVKTQYFNEEIDATGGMFSAAHRALMASDRPSLPDKTTQGQADPPSASRRDGRFAYAFLLDVAGQEEASTSAGLQTGQIELEPNAARDAVTLRVIEIDLSTLETLQAPTYRVVHTQQWTGLNHLTVFGQLKALGETWKPQHVVVDATGVGEGLWAMLDRAFPTRVIPVKFTQAVKSELGYGFLAIINSGRFRDCVPSQETDRQYAACECEILIGPTKTMRWGVPDGRRDPDGRLIHDDIPVTDSLTAILDRLDWSISSPTLIIRPRDPLDDMSHFSE